jgi:hypothetical protein
VLNIPARVEQTGFFDKSAIAGGQSASRAAQIHRLYELGKAANVHELKRAAEANPDCLLEAGQKHTVIFEGAPIQRSAVM